MSTRRPSPELVLRAVLIGLGALAVAKGAHLVLTWLQPRQWLNVAIWMAVGSVLHDLLIAPASLLLGRLLRIGLRRPVAVRAAANPLRGIWLAAGSAVAIGVTLLKGAELRRNPTVIPGRPGLNLALSLGLVLAGGGLVIAVNLFRNRPARPPAPARPTSPVPPATPVPPPI